ncbi:MAG: DUF2306 domain-containing protein [Parvularcula sp.]
MKIDLLFVAPWFVQVHVIAAIVAFFLGVVQFLAPKGTLPHKSIGVVWILLMTVVTASSVLIQRPVAPGDPFWARFSWIHLFTVLTAIGLISGTLRLLIGGPNLKRHAGPFTGAFVGGLVIAGFFAHMPGRLMHDVITGECTSNIAYQFGKPGTCKDD